MMSDSPEELADLLHKIRNSEGRKLVPLWDALEISLDIFWNNYLELKLALDQFSRPEVAMVLWRLDNQEALDKYIDLVTRRLHNYVASAMTLKDQTVRWVRKTYSGAEFMNEYQSELDRCFTNSGVAKFMQDLRNYTLHVSLVTSYAQLGMNVNREMESHFVMNTSRLMGWKGWKKESKQYLNQCEAEIKLAEVVEEYTNIVLDFHSWFRQRQAELHRTTVEEYNELVERWNKSLAVELPQSSESEGK
jgi:hypothetical protein